MMMINYHYSTAYFAKHGVVFLASNHFHMISNREKSKHSNDKAEHASDLRAKPDSENLLTESAFKFSAILPYFFLSHDLRQLGLGSVIGENSIQHGKICRRDGRL